MSNRHSSFDDYGAVLPDWQIRNLHCIEPFSEGIKRPGVISYGLTSAGYDARLGNNFKLFTNSRCPTMAVDPKRIDPRMFDIIEPTQDETGRWVAIPPHGYILGETLEYFKIPRDIICLVVGKSTYARTGILINVTPGEPCVSDDTEVLSREGWRFVSDVLLHQDVLTRRADGIAEYQPVQRKQSRYHKGTLLHFQGKVVDQLVTRDHKLFTWFHNSRPGTRLAENVFGRYGHSFDRQVDWRGEQDPETITIGGTIYPASDFLFFFGCWLGDGSAYHGTDGGYSIKLAVVTKEKKRNTFRDALRTLKIKAREHSRGFHWYNKNLSTWLQQFGHAKDKYIPREFLSYSPRLLHHLLNGLMASDGTINKPGSGSRKMAGGSLYTTSSKQLADDVQELIYKCGMTSSIRSGIHSIAGGVPFTAYKVTIASGWLTPKIDPRQQSEVPYKGMVYDITVPNHVFLSRRNGKVAWTGNCWGGRWTIEISNSNPLPAKVYAGEGICQILFIATAGTCERSYEEKGGKYHQDDGLTLPKVD